MHACRSRSAPRLPFGLFLALRYLKPRRTFVSIITLISVLGVTLGIAVLIVVISRDDRLRPRTAIKVLGFDPHIEVTNGALHRRLARGAHQVDENAGRRGVVALRDGAGARRVQQPPRRRRTSAASIPTWSAR